MKEKHRPAIHDKPAVGLELDGQVGSIASALQRASAQGYEVLLVCNEANRDVAHLAELLDASVVSCDAVPPSGNPLERLLEAAFDKGYPGLIYHRDLTEPVNYELLEETLSEEGGYIVEAESDPPHSDHRLVVVAVPAYNEEASIEGVVQECSEYADEVIVIDDGSEDRTYDRATAAGATVVRHHQNKGYGAAVKSAFEEAHRRRADHLVLVDGDGQHDPTDIPKLLGKQREEDAHIVIGSRFIGSQTTSIPRYRRFGIMVVNVLTNLYLGIIGSDLRVTDTQCGFRAYDERAIRSLAENRTITDDMDASVEILYHAIDNGFDIAEVETSVEYHPEAVSSYNPIYHGTILVRNILLNLERVRPSLFPGVVGLFSIAVSLTIAVWILSDTFPIAVLVAGVISVLSLLAGLVLLISAIVSRSFLIH